MDADSPTTMAEVESHVRELCRSEGLPEPDEVVRNPASGEVQARWTEHKVAIVIEMSDGADRERGAACWRPLYAV